MNYILFFPDEMRAESLACYGHPLVKTPNYDNLAKDGVRFDKCFVQNTVCSPSRICMMTGKYPHVDAHRTLWNLLEPNEPSLFEYMKNSGYQIHWFGKNDLYSQESLPKCVDSYIDCKGGHNGEEIYPFGQDGYYGFLKKPFKSVEESSDYKNVQKAIEFIQSWKEGDKPFVVYMPLSMPHPVYSAPDKFHDMYSIDELPPLRPKVEKGKPSYQKLIPKYRNLENMDDNFYKKINAVYLGMISCVDMLLGNLVEAVENSNAKDNTTIFATSDHGDFAGDYGLVEKWPNCFDDCLSRVPLIVKSPIAKAGHVVNEQVELFDIMPTIMEMENIESEHTHYATSLVNQLKGENGDENRIVYAEGGYNENEPNCFEGYEKRIDLQGIKNKPTHIYYPKFRQQQERPESVCRATMLRSLDYKLVYRPNDVSELYDLKIDPQELNNVFNDESYAIIQNRLLLKMLNWYSDTSDSVKFKENPRGFVK